MLSFLKTHLLRLVSLLLSVTALVSCSKEKLPLQANVAKNVNAAKKVDAPRTTNPSAHCIGSEIHTIVRPVFPNSKDSGSPVFTYSFRLRKAKVENAPTIIYLPGGPGGPSMENGVESWMDDFNYVFTDVRGSGCNEFRPEDLPDDSIRTEYAASDILAIIDYLSDPQKSEIKLGNYLIHGVSYGTVLATVVGSQIENSSLPQPRGIVLEGVLGKHREHTDRQHYETILQYWHELTPFISDHVKAEFRSSQNPFGIGISGNRWANTILMTLSIGSILKKYDEKSKKIEWEHVLPYLLNGLPSTDRIEALQKLSKINVADSTNKRAYSSIACHELFRFDSANDELEPGELKLDEDFKVEIESQANSHEECEGKPLDRPYDSALYQLKTPLYYFQGSLDPQTLYEEAKYHYDHQHHASKYFVTFKLGGHTPLKQELSLFQGTIFKQIIEAPQYFNVLIAGLVQAGSPLLWYSATFRH